MCKGPVAGESRQRTKRSLAMLCETGEMGRDLVIRNPSVESSLDQSYMFGTQYFNPEEYVFTGVSVVREDVDLEKNYGTH